MVPVANRLDLRAALDGTGGTVTNFLEKLVNEKIVASAHHHDMIEARKGNPLRVEEGEPLLRRAATLQGAESGRSYVYAQSVIVVGRLPSGFCNQLETSSDPIGRVLDEMGIAVIRQSVGEPVGAPRPNSDVKVGDYLLARTYRLDSDQTPVMMITEWFLKTLAPFLVLAQGVDESPPEQQQRDDSDQAFGVTGPTAYARRLVELNPVEIRILGSLAEKQLTTPQQYPLTLNALILACNQSSNRDPVVAYDETTVEVALSSLKEAGLLRFVHPGKGASATRYRQVLDERLGLNARSLSVLAVLTLRGPQTVGELRARTERMADFGNLEEIDAELERLAEGTDPLVCRLPRRPGQKEERWAQLLSGETPEPGATEDSDTHSNNAPDQRHATPLDAEVSSLRNDVDALKNEVAGIKAVVEELRVAFDL